MAAAAAAEMTARRDALRMGKLCTARQGCARSGKGGHQGKSSAHPSCRACDLAPSRKWDPPRGPLMGGRSTSFAVHWRACGKQVVTGPSADAHLRKHSL